MYNVYIMESTLFDLLYRTQEETRSKIGDFFCFVFEYLEDLDIF